MQLLYYTHGFFLSFFLSLLHFPLRMRGLLTFVTRSHRVCAGLYVFACEILAELLPCLLLASISVRAWVSKASWRILDH